MKKVTGNTGYRRQYKNSYGIRVGSTSGVVLPSDLYQEQSAPTISLFDTYEYLPFIKDGELEQLIALVNNSPTAQSIVNKFVTYIIGEGFYLKTEKDIFGDMVTVEVTTDQKKALYNILNRKNADGDNILDICRKAAYDYKATGNCFARIDISSVKGKKYVFLSHQNVNFVRPFRSPDLRVRYFGVSQDWALIPFLSTMGYEGQKLKREIEGRYKASKIYDVPAYPDFSMSDVDDEQYGIGEDTETPAAMLHVKKYAPLMYAWGQPDWSSGKHWAELDYRIAKFNISRMKNGFTPSGFLQIFGDITPEEQKKYQESMVSKMTDTGNDFKVIFQFLENPELKANWVPFEQNIDGYFKELSDICVEQVCRSFRFPMSLTQTTPGQLGGNQQLRSEVENFYASEVNADQRAIVDGILRPFLDTVADNEPGMEFLKDIELGFINIIPVSFAGDLNVENYLTTTEGRELLGYSELKPTEMTVTEEADAQVDKPGVMARFFKRIFGIK